MAERKLPIRKRRFSKGREIRISDLVYSTLDKGRRGQSWDAYLRKLIGLPDRSGNPQPLAEGIVETITGRFYLKQVGMTWLKLTEDAYEVAITEAAKRRLYPVPKPLRVKEMP